jgi:hypothetical protein
MRDNVTFRCRLPIDLDKHPPGEELAMYLADKMTQAGLPTRVIDNYNDFAWWLEGESSPPRPWVLVGYVGDGPAEWLVTINSGVGWLGRVLGRSDEAGRRQFADRLHAVLSADANFSDVRWHVGDWNDSGWSSSPD